MLYAKHVHCALCARRDKAWGPRRGDAGFWSDQGSKCLPAWVSDLHWRDGRCSWESRHESTWSGIIRIDTHAARLRWLIFQKPALTWASAVRIGARWQGTQGPSESANWCTDHQPLSQDLESCAGCLALVLYTAMQPMFLAHHLCDIDSKHDVYFSREVLRGHHHAGRLVKLLEDSVRSCLSTVHMCGDFSWKCKPVYCPSPPPPARTPIHLRVHI